MAQRIGHDAVERLKQRKKRRDQAKGVAHKRRPVSYRFGVESAYRVHMGDGREAAEGWGAYLRRMTKRPGWSVARLARESNVHRATIFKYIKGEKAGVTVATVKAIAAALGDDPANALRAAGTVAPDVDPADEELELVRSDPDLTPELKVLIADIIMEHRAREREAALAETRRLIELMKRRA